MIVDKIKCPYCGYVMPLRVDPDAKCKGVWIKCKGRNCKKEFEIYNISILSQVSLIQRRVSLQETLGDFGRQIYKEVHTT